MTDRPIPSAALAVATVEIQRLCAELDITNADHIALWLEANADASLGYRSCRIVEVYEAAIEHLKG